MVKLENEYFVRFILLLIKGGSQILRKLFSKGLEKRNVSLEQFLHDEKQTITSKDLTKLQIDKLYYSPEPPDISTWDISLLCHIVLLQFFGLDSSQTAAVKKIREMRNQYQAHTCDASIEIRHFHTIWNELVLVITFLSHEIDKNDRIELMDLINSIASEQLDMNASIEELKNLDRTDELFESIHRSIERMEMSLQQEVKACHQDVLELKQIMIPDLSTIKQELIQIRTRMIHDGENIKEVYTVFGKVRVSALEQTTVDTAEQILLSASKDSISDIASPQVDSNVRECVDKFKEDVERKNVRIDEVNKGSVIFTFKCSSLTALVDLIDYFNEEGIQPRIGDLEKALEDILGQKVSLLAYLPDEPILDIVTRLKNVKPGTLQFSMECTGKEGLIHAWKMFEEDSGYLSLNKLSSSLSKSLGKEVKLTPYIDTESMKRAIMQTKESFEVTENDDNLNRFHEMASDSYPSLDVTEETGFERKSEHEIEEENVALLADIVDLCERSDHKNSEVILLIGKTGAGKSALVNTIHKVITGRYYNIAKHGRGKAQTVTLDLNRYENCGVSLETIKDLERKNTMKRILSKLPHIIDCGGLGDEDSPELSELLELFIGGFLPPNINLEALQSKQKEFGVGCLKRVFPNAEPAWSVTKVIFVQSCTDSIPKNLIQCLMKVLNTIDEARLMRKYSAEVFLLFTKYDLVKETDIQLALSKYGESESVDKREEKSSFDMEHLKKLETEVAFEFNMIGALETNRLHWINFTDRVREYNPFIDNKALKFLRFMLEPRRPVPEPLEPAIGIKKSIELYVYRFINVIQGVIENRQEYTWSFFFAVAVFAVVIAVLYKLLSASI